MFRFVIIVLISFFVCFILCYLNIFGLLFVHDDAFVSSLDYDSGMDFGDFFGLDGIFWDVDGYLVAHSLAEESFSELKVHNNIKFSEGFVEVDEQGIVIG